MYFTKKEIAEIMRLEDQNEIASLFKLARNKRNEVTDNKIFTYGFVYFTTYCRNDCAFCYYRKSNKIERYRKSEEEVLELSKNLADSGVNLIDLTMGEDPKYHYEHFDTVNDLIRKIKIETGLPVMISPGVVSEKEIENFATAGADFYALYQETHNRKLFEKLRLNQDYDERMNSKKFAKEKGMLIEEGLLSGVGESYEDIADSIFEMGEVGASQIRVMSFIPQQGSPMENVNNKDRMQELKIIAVMRLMYPGALIPASLDIDGIAGLKDRINAGANLVTSIIPPKTGLAGVAQSRMDVDDGGRTVEEVSSILKQLGLRVASNKEYADYIGKFRC